MKHLKHVSVAKAQVGDVDVSAKLAQLLPLLGDLDLDFAQIQSIHGDGAG